MINTSRHVLGLSIGPRHDGIDAALLAVDGVGMSMQPRMLKTLHVADADSPMKAIRKIMLSAGVDARDLFCVGLQTPKIMAIESVAEAIADATGITVLTAFDAHDFAAGGRGTPLTALPEYLIAKSNSEDRIVIHLDDTTSLMFIPENAKSIEVQARDAGPGTQLLDTIIDHGTRGKNHHDTTGTLAVQGQPDEALINNWLKSGFQSTDATIDGIIDGESHRSGNLSDLLCTATHFIARCVGHSVRQWLSTSDRPRSVFVSGGGTRNGFLWQLLQQQFPHQTLHRSDDIGMPALARHAVAAAVLGTLTIDGIPGNLSHLTGASGGRLLGRLIPGDPRNWAEVATWSASRMNERIRMSRAA